MGDDVQRSTFFFVGAHLSVIGNPPIAIIIIFHGPVNKTFNGVAAEQEQEEEENFPISNNLDFDVKHFLQEIFISKVGVAAKKRTLSRN